jgi:hypothetical protein
MVVDWMTKVTSEEPWLIAPAAWVLAKFSPQVYQGFEPTPGQQDWLEALAQIIRERFRAALTARAEKAAGPSSGLCRIVEDTFVSLHAAGAEGVQGEFAAGLMAMLCLIETFESALGALPRWELARLSEHVAREAGKLPAPLAAALVAELARQEAALGEGPARAACGLRCPGGLPAS